MVQGVSLPAVTASTSINGQTPTEAQIYSSVGLWLRQVLLTGTVILEGQENFTPSPIGPYVVMEIVSRQRLATNSWSYANGERSLVEPVRMGMQINLFGRTAGENVGRIQQLWRDFYTTDALRALGGYISPIDTSEPSQAPLVNAEANYEDQWTIDLRFQVNLTTVIHQDFASSAIPDLDAVDAYPIIAE